MMPFGDSGRSFMSRLRQEVEAWEREGTITAEQAQEILARYPEDSPDYEAARRRQALVVGFSILGAVLVGLGVITFFAANWDEIPRGVKLGALFAGVAISYGAGYLLWQRLGYTAVGIALVLLGSIIFGAGVHLIGQIYHVPVDHPDLTAFWFLGVLPLAYAIRSRPVTFLAIVLFLAAVGFRLNYWDQFAGRVDEIGIFALYAGLGLSIYAIGRVKQQFPEWDPMGGAFRATGLVVAFAALYVLTFESLHGGGETVEGLSSRYWSLAYVAAVVAVASLAWVVWGHRGNFRSSLVEVCELAAVLVLLAAFHLVVQIPAEDEVIYTIVFNVLFALSVLGMLISGYLQGNEARVNLALGLTALFIITRYFEYSTTLFDLSLVLVGAGVILLAGGFLLERGRRRLMASMRAGDGQR